MPGLVSQQKLLNPFHLNFVVFKNSPLLNIGVNSECNFTSTPAHTFLV